MEPKIKLTAAQLTVLTSLSEAQQAKVVAYIYQNGPASVGVLARKLGLRVSHVRRDCEQACQMSQILRDQVGSRVKYRPTMAPDPADLGDLLGESGQ
jgi:predicted transcriptional regulator